MDYKLVDLRIVDRNIRKGTISRKEYDKFVAGLPDVEENSTELILDEDVEETESDEEFAGLEAVEVEGDDDGESEEAGEADSAE